MTAQVINEGKDKEEVDELESTEVSGISRAGQ